MVELQFDGTTYGFKISYTNSTNNLHIFVNGKLEKIKEQVSVLPSTIEEVLELIREYDL
jgi:hypothetical protein